MQSNPSSNVQIGGLIVSVFSFLISALALYVSRKSWQQANRPIVTARVASEGRGGDQGTALNIIVENTGNRPATNIRLTVSSDALESLFAENDAVNLTWRRIITKVFSNRGVIPILGTEKASATVSAF